MSFIVIEGLDGSGKSTQLELLKKYFISNNKKIEYIHFPTNNSPIFGDLISRFLRGEFGNLNQVDPYLVALIFAGDRYNMSNQINDWLNEGKIVINDRYVYSNIAYQCAKINDNKKSEELFNWIINLEYNYFKIPKPDLSIFLDVPFNFTKQNLIDRKKLYRDYLKGKVDIHENDLKFQKNVKKIYLKAINLDNNFIKIKCYKNNKILDPTIISSKIIEKINM